MAQWHVAGVTRGGLEVVIHFLVPAGPNAVGVAWKEAALKYGFSGGEPSVWADAADIAGIAAGDIIELQARVSVDRTADLAAQQSVVQRHVDRAIAAKKLEWSQVLKYAGHSEGEVT